MDQATEPISSQDVGIRVSRGWTGAPGGQVLVQRPMWPVGVVMVGVLAEDELQMAFPSDQHLVQAFPAGAADAVATTARR